MYNITRFIIYVMLYILIVYLFAIIDVNIFLSVNFGQNYTNLT